MNLDLDAIKARLAAACPGPWTPGKLRRSVDGDCLMLVREDNPYVIAATLIPQYGDDDTAVMLLHSRADMDALVAEVERLRGLVVSMVENVVDAATAREAGITFAAVRDIANDYRDPDDPDSFGRMVERLRELALNSAEKIAAQGHDDHVMDVQHAHEEGIAEGRDNERASVVAWLRASAPRGHAQRAALVARVMGDAARDIERGEHRREEKP